MENNWNICKHKLDIYKFKVKHYPIQGSNSKKTFHQSSFFSWTVHPTLLFCNLLVCATPATTEIDFLSVGRSCLTLAPTLLFCNLLLQLHAKPTKTDFLLPASFWLFCRIHVVIARAKSLALQLMCTQCVLHTLQTNCFPQPWPAFAHNTSKPNMQKC